MLASGMWYRIESKNATFGICVKGGVVVDSAPIGKKSIGRSWEQVQQYYKNVWKAKIEKLE